MWARLEAHQMLNGAVANAVVRASNSEKGVYLELLIFDWHFSVVWPPTFFSQSIPSPIILMHYPLHIRCSRSLGQKQRISLWSLICELRSLSLSLLFDHPSKKFGNKLWWFPLIYFRKGIRIYSVMITSTQCAHQWVKSFGNSTSPSRGVDIVWDE